MNEKLFSKPTYAAFINLLNNYQRATGHGEHFSAQQLEEQVVFLREVMKTDVMKELYSFLRHQSEWTSSSADLSSAEVSAGVGCGGTGCESEAIG